MPVLPRVAAAGSKGADFSRGEGRTPAAMRR